MRRCHTAELTAAELAEIRALLDASFADFTDHDWTHALGGQHALLTEDGSIVAHGALVTRRLTTGGRSLRCGYVEAVAVREDARRRGLGAAVMESLEDLGPAFDVLALCSSAAGVALYASRGWVRWRGPTSTTTAAGVEPTPDEDGAVWVLGGPAVAELDLDGGLTCDWRAGDVW